MGGEGKKMGLGKSKRESKQAGKESMEEAQGKASIKQVGVWIAHILRPL